MHNTSIEFDVDSLSEPRCEPLDKLSLHCQKYGPNITIPNMFGARTQSDARDMTNIARTILESGCHQHVEEFGCRSIYPECSSYGVRYPCRSMCEEVLSACGHLFDLFDRFPIVDCLVYPNTSSPKSCFHQPVKCGSLTNPRFGHVRVYSTTLGGRARYSCDATHYLVGFPDRVCQATGRWDGVEPLCECVFNRSTVIILIVASSVAFVLMLTLFVMMFKSELHILCSSRLGVPCLKTKYDPSRKHDVFVLFHFTDMTWVMTEFIPKLEHHNPPYSVVSQMDFIAGSVTLDCVEDAMKNSKVCAVIVSQALLDSPQDLHTFRAVTTEASKNSATFKVIPILMDRSLKQGNVPPIVRNYLRLGKCLKMWSRWFWDTLIAELPDKGWRRFHPGDRGCSDSSGSDAGETPPEEPASLSDIIQANRFSTTGPLIDISDDPQPEPGIVNGLLNTSSNIYYL